jgi:hypothetical protein
VKQCFKAINFTQNKIKQPIEDVIRCLGWQWLDCGNGWDVVVAGIWQWLDCGNGWDVVGVGIWQLLDVAMLSWDNVRDCTMVAMRQWLAWRNGWDVAMVGMRQWLGWSNGRDVTMSKCFACRLF